MKLHITDEFSPLKDVVVCWGSNIPKYEDYAKDDPEYIKYHKRTWNKDLLIKQQESFFKALEKYSVRLHFLKTKPNLIWQMYTRDTAFVVRDQLYFTHLRAFKERLGEMEELAKLLQALGITTTQELKTGTIEGGDVIVDKQGILVGNGGRTQAATISELLEYETGRKLFLGEHVMHLDTRLTLLPRNYALIISEAFSQEDIAFLESRYKLLHVLPEEALDLGTNVFMVNPETVFSPLQNERINEMLKKEGFNVEKIDYTEPIALGGSFRCTTLPLVRDASIY
ncbi:MAG: N(G),N(G)-dimethylarginine dimethylaminohydrolase [Microgenomates bacterium OLB23]|nr:MAG: N(G),N(G)-dimethylarginine dimethylaminohydrolase [Microgenomates bacterium OLB23]